MADTNHKLGCATRSGSHDKDGYTGQCNCRPPQCYKCVQGVRHPFCDSGEVNDEAAALKVWGTDGGPF